MHVRVHLLSRQGADIVLEGCSGNPEPMLMDGVAAPAHRPPCEAHSETRGTQCAELSAVLLATMDDRHVALCGSHYGIHRSGMAFTLPGRRV
ncbi:hypothetical protein BH23CHL8_BH23CHL8_26300 [soil metagenome]